MGGLEIDNFVMCQTGGIIKMTMKDDSIITCNQIKINDWGDAMAMNLWLITMADKIDLLIDGATIKSIQNI